MKRLIALAALLLCSDAQPVGLIALSGGFIQSSGATGVWVNVTPSGVNLTSDLDCSNYGINTVVVDPSNPSNLYGEFNCQGIWKSTNYGQTWSGPINTGTNGAVVGDGACGISIGANSAGNPPTLYESCIRGGTITCSGCTSGTAVGFWISTNGGVDWTAVNLTPLSSSRQDVYWPTVDPYDPTHLLMTGHEQAYLLESTNSGSTWTQVPNTSGLLATSGTAFAQFINTGSSSTTRTTYLVINQDTPYGTLLTTNDGSSWTVVDQAVHPHGEFQAYQAGGSGINQIGSGKIFLGQLYSGEGTGVITSTNNGATWTSSLSTGSSGIVWGTSEHIYAAYGYPCNSGGAGNTCGISPNIYEIAQPGTGSWSAMSTPSGMTGNGLSAVAVTNDGSHNVLVAAMWLSGLWRYVEP